MSGLAGGAGLWTLTAACPWTWICTGARAEKRHLPSTQTCHSCKQMTGTCVGTWSSFPTGVPCCCPVCCAPLTCSCASAWSLCHPSDRPWKIFCGVGPCPCPCPCLCPFCLCLSCPSCLSCRCQVVKNGGQADALEECRSEAAYLSSVRSKASALPPSSSLQNQSRCYKDPSQDQLNRHTACAEIPFFAVPAVLLWFSVSLLLAG